MKQAKHTIAAFNWESYEFLEENFPLFADALKADIADGVLAEDIRRDAKRNNKSDEMVTRLYQAACYLQAAKVKVSS
jgi:hypothetical protein